MKRTISLITALILSVSLLAGCGSSAENNTTAAEASVTKETSAASAPAEEKTTDVDNNEAEDKEAAEEVGSDESEASNETAVDGTPWLVPAEDAVPLADLKCIGKMKLEYAKQFDVYYYEGGYKVINIKESDDYLIVPEGADIPETDMIVLQQPFDKIYLQATAVMALFRAIDGLSNIKFVGTKAEGWYIEEAVEAINNGEMVFAGKYSEPDYETLIEGDCSIAIESTMIYHTPKVKEMLEDLGIPVFVEYSAIEPQALGRTEWVKVYAAMLNLEDKAFEFFEGQNEIVKKVEQVERTDKSVVYFYISTEGTAVVPNDNTYTVEMIEAAGGNYVFNELSKEFDSATVALTMEAFYAQAMDADYIIYNSSIDSNIESVDDLISKEPLLADFKAVKDGNVWCTGKSLFQSTDRLAYMILDISNMLAGGDPGDMMFLSKVK